jgi:hypothetical protein
LAEVSSYRITPRTINRTQIESYYKTQLQKKIHRPTASSTAGFESALRPAAGPRFARRQGRASPGGRAALRPAAGPRFARRQGRASPDPSAQAQRMSVPRGNESASAGPEGGG